MNATQIVKRAEGPAFATDKKGRIVGWNEAARELLGSMPAKEIRGQPLHTILDLRDAFGNRLDLGQMPLYHMVTRGEPIQGFEVSASKNGGGRVHLSVAVVVVLGPGRANYQTVYLMRPILRRRKADEVIERVLANPANGRHVLDRDNPGQKDVPSLTRRQTVTAMKKSRKRCFSASSPFEAISRASWTSSRCTARWRPFLGRSGTT
jgi:hypothetical protein